VAVLPDAKGLFPESHENFIGTYWGAVSSPCCCETVEAADLVITAGKRQAGTGAVVASAL
jgi:pyruvate decarboxylase